MKRLFLSLAVLTLFSPSLHAGVGSTAAKHGSRLLIKQGVKQTAKQAAKETAEQATKRLASQAATASSRRMAARAASQFGDDIARAGGKFTDDFAVATARLSGQQQRRMAMLAKNMSPTAKKTLMTRVSKSTSPGAVIDDLWKHKGKIAVGVGAVTIAAHGDEIAKAGGQYVAKPLIESVMAPMAQLLSSTLYALLICFLVLTVGLALGVCRGNLVAKDIVRSGWRLLRSLPQRRRR